MSDGFLYYALIFLAAAVIVVPLAKRSGLGAVLGYLLAGIAIGPFGLELINNPETILHFAEFGVVMMLFLIGLELQPKTLWRLRKSILGLGGSQVLLTTFLGTIILLLMGLEFNVSLAIALGLSLSSTALVIQLMNERHLLPTYTGQSTFSVLLFQDVAIIPILAIIPLLASAGNITSVTEVIEVVEQQAGGNVWEKTLTVIGLVSVLVLFGHYGVRHLLRYIAQTGIREIFTAFALLLVIGVTFLMKSVGLSPALGAFIAGVILADSAYRHEIETQIEPFKALLLGLFFISVGMSIDFNVFTQFLYVILSGVVGLILLKFAVLFLLAKLFKFDISQNLIFSILLAQGGEFAFVIFQFANQENLLSQDVTSILNVIVALSMVATPFLILFYDRFLSPRFSSFSSLDTPSRQPSLNFHQNSDVIILGYGRFGQIIGRLLKACGIQPTILDHDPKQIEFLAKFGWKVYYGDVSDMDLLEKAGANKARFIVMAIDDRDQAVAAVKAIKERFPSIKILSRAYDRRHAYELRKAGVDYFERETFGSALSMGTNILERLGFETHQAQNLAWKFAQHDHKTLVESFKHFEDEKALISLALQSRDELEKIFQADLQEGKLDKE
jgi:glutathione-regulated potassium-efflux system ancillary protein KefC